MKTEKALSDLTSFQRALTDHLGWLQKWYQAVLYQGDIPDPAADTCPFSKWHSGPAAESLSKYDIFGTVRAEHELVHSMACQFTERAASGHAITTSDFETLMTASLSFGAAAQTLEREVWKTLSTLDPLTGLSNRQLMRTQLVRERDRAIREKKSLCVALADIDFFKNVNDTYGHTIGDTVLREVSDVFSLLLRPYDFVYRYGGEEFLFCLPGTSLETAVIALDRIREAVAKHAIHDSNGVQVKVTVTIGVADINADISVEDCIERADKALYSGKNAGRNCVKAFEGK
jgi:diguanylate cyclase (GGDEF)-like protein